MRKSSKPSRRFAAPLLLAAFAMVAACTNAGSNSSGNATITVPDSNIWGEESSALQIMYDLFAAENPDIEIKEVTVEDYAPALAAGEAPDLMLMDPFAAKESYKQNYVEPLDRYYEQYGWDEGMFDWAKNAYSIDGKTVGIPWNYEGLLLVYNETLFQENGWSVPTNYNELTALSENMKAEGIIPFAWGTADCPGCDDWWISSIVNSVLGPEGTKQLFSGDGSWTDPVVADALGRFADYWRDGNLSDKKSHSISQEDSIQLFATGRAAMRLDGTWSLASDIETGFDVGYAAFPSWKEDGEPVIPLGVGGGLVINAKSEHKDEVAKLLSYFFHPDVIRTMAENGIPEPVEADYSQFDLKPNVSKALAIINDAAKSGKTGYVAWSYGSPSVVGVLQSDVASLYLDKMSVDDWLKDLQAKKQKDVGDNTLFDLSNY
ncbi:ABC transporter substrate-binding protein [Paenibacillus sp.]|uniref:ABC transporter substrate-binding protein n=1 Tax=Paenibacillus sp. TaxID=58172 RepID=UPI002D2C7263|nr:extracellular solute-binding protein [Paenibacillus sp.]HZG58751.1 extracellular solute-binding protein [Paenibacillus sp.]